MIEFLAAIAAAPIWNPLAIALLAGIYWRSSGVLSALHDHISADAENFRDVRRRLGNIEERVL